MNDPSHVVFVEGVDGPEWFRCNCGNTARHNNPANPSVGWMQNKPSTPEEDHARKLRDQDSASARARLDEVDHQISEWINRRNRTHDFRDRGYCERMINDLSVERERLRCTAYAS